MRHKRYVKSGVIAKKPLKFRVWNKPIADTVGNVGQCWPHTKKHNIEIDPRQSPKDYLDTLIHESLHEIFPGKKESAILNAGTSLANLLWRLGYRRVKKNN
jgi:hypothetical protein